MKIVSCIFLTVVVTGLVDSKPFIRIESVIHDMDSQPVNSTIHDDIPIFTTTKFVNNVVGELMPFSPIDACEPLEASMYTTLEEGRQVFQPSIHSSNIIAIVKDGNCSLKEKIRIIEQIPNVAGVILVSPEDAIPEKTDFTFLNTRLTIFVINSKNGDTLTKLTDWYRQHRFHDNLAYPTISNDTGSIVFNQDKMPEPSWIKATLYYSDKGLTIGVVEFSLIIVIVLMTMAFITSVGLHCYFYNTRPRGLGSGLQEPAEEHRLVPRDRLGYFKIDTFGYFKSLKLDHKSFYGSTRNKSLGEAARSSPDENQVNDTCPICLEDYADTDALRILPCHHVYHPPCIDEWLVTKASKCPLCKFDIFRSLEELAKTESGTTGDEDGIPVIERRTRPRAWRWIRTRILAF